MYRYRLVSTVAFALACNSPDPGYVSPVKGKTVAVSQFASSNLTGVQVAITVDDLPWSDPSASTETRSRANTRLMHTLLQRRATASMFVNCARAGNDIPILKEWLAQGFELGNHTARHLSIDQAGAAAWLEDVRACDIPLRALIGKSPRFFRYPMLRQGATRARRDSAADGIARLGYLNALAADGAVFVPLNTALLDPVYSMPDLYIGSRGWSWLYRIAPLDPIDASWDDAEAARVESALSAMLLRQPRRRTGDAGRSKPFRRGTT